MDQHSQTRRTGQGRCRSFQYSGTFQHRGTATQRHGEKKGKNSLISALWLRASVSLCFLAVVSAVLAQPRLPRPIGVIGPAPVRPAKPAAAADDSAADP